jgi:hypothetical protein
VTDDDDDDASDDPPAPDETPDASDPAQQKRQRRKRETEQEAVARLWRIFLSEKAGRKWLWDFLTIRTQALNNLFPVSFAGFPDHAAKWFADGKKGVGMDLFMELSADCHELVLLMQIEHNPRFSALKQRFGAR